MLAKISGLGLVLFVTACTGANRHAGVALESRAHSPGLFVGHSTDGDTVIASSHYLAMNGLATTDSDLGIPPREDGASGEMLCRREMLTGTHVPRWVCRYEDDLSQGREFLHSVLAAPVLSIDRKVLAPALSVRGAPGMRMPLP